MRHRWLLALFVLAGCEEDSEIGGLTAEENRQLNEAADMLESEPAMPVAREELEEAEAAREEPEPGELPVTPPPPEG
ncbi:MAG: hypothetical protein ACFBQW_07750 [Sphingomonadaceae bacterium]